MPWSFEQLERSMFEAIRLARVFDRYPSDVDALTGRAIDTGGASRSARAA